ncbi:CRISPR-associated RAMP Cmr4 [Candidatus Magnetomorum sp. HK-1]|nr:CRISPR-associated RAMP Cmr4 [Candidatus Magnetomorum sp. HK-1]
MYTHKGYLIETITNTHVGAGDTDYGVVDNMIQRDSRTAFPIVHPSSLKGAIRDHFHQYIKDDSTENSTYLIAPYTYQALFGEDKKDTLKKMEKSSVDSEKKLINFLLKYTPRKGLVTFFEARLLTLPLRSTKKVFHHTTCPHAAIDYLENMIHFNIVNNIDEMKNLIAFFKHLQNLLASSNKEFIIFSKADPTIEDFNNSISMGKNNTGNWKSFDYLKIKELMSKYFSPNNDQHYLNSLAVFHDDLFKNICESGLPVIARNQLSNDGISENLFYEEILPRRSVLWFMTGTYSFDSLEVLPEYESEGKYFNEAFKLFHDRLTIDHIQIGANESIGYGVTSISEIGKGGLHE